MPVIHEKWVFTMPNQLVKEHLQMATVCGKIKVVSGEKNYVKHLAGYEIAFVLGGKGRFDVGGELYCFEQDDLTLIPLQLKPGYLADSIDPYEVYLINFESYQMGNLLGDAFKPDSPSIVKTDRSFALGVFEEMMHYCENQPKQWETRVSGLIYLLLMEFYRDYLHRSAEASQNPDWVESIRDWVEYHMSEKIVLADLADRANMSLYHFVREFRKYFEYSPMEYVNFRRVTRAKQLLLRSDQRIEHISESVGFSNHFAMIRNFHKFVGASPSNFRRAGFER